MGIGIAAPSTLFEVAQNNAIKLGTAELSSGGNYANLATNAWYNGGAWQFPIAGQPGALIQLSGNVTYFFTHNALAFTPTMAIIANGNVGIGTIVPTDKLTIAGNVVPSGDNLYSCGKAGARWTAVWCFNGAIQTSDKRFKDNIKDMDYGLKEIMQLRPVTYTWKDKPEQGRKVGFIAQEVQSVIKEVVYTGDDAQKSLGINYAELVPVMVNAMKEQQTSIDELKNEVEVLKKQIADLSSAKTTEQK